MRAWQFSWLGVPIRLLHPVALVGLGGALILVVLAAGGRVHGIVSVQPFPPKSSALALSNIINIQGKRMPSFCDRDEAASGSNPAT